MTQYELWEAKYNTMDAPFPLAMMPDIEKFFREVHPTLKPGQDSYPEVFATELFFPLQRRRELEKMMQIARGTGPVCPTCRGATMPMPPSEDADCKTCKGTCQGPVTVMEIGADKGGGLYHWCMCLPTVRNVIACEIRGTPYSELFCKAFLTPHFPYSGDCRMTWLNQSSYDQVTTDRVKRELTYGPIDVLFIDGDKLGFLKDFYAYLPLMRQPGGVVFLHDITDKYKGGPGEAFQILKDRGFRAESIVDTTEVADADDTPHGGWLKHWRGRSCGVGVIYV
jgi:hypothetical protein